MQLALDEAREQAAAAAAMAERKVESACEAEAAALLKVSGAVEEKLLDCLVGPSNIQHNREAFRKLLRMGHLDDRLIEVDVPERKGGGQPGMEGNPFPMNEIILRFDKMMQGRQKSEKREMLLKDSVPILTEIESEKMLNEDDLKRQAVELVEQEGIVFIDEIDKERERASNPRPLLPLILGVLR